MHYIEQKVGNYMMRLLPGEGGIHHNLIKIAKKGGEREPELLYMIRKELKPGMTCLDLGANIGYITLLLADLVGKSGTIYAIEPDPRNIKLLRRNVDLNNFQDRIKIIHMGMSNKDGEMDFYIGKTSNLGGMTKTNNTKNKSIRVKVETLDTFCKQFGVPELIKMDIEGHEVEVLEGMHDTVKNQNSPCKIIMELHPTNYSKTHNLEKWMKKYLECGFKVKYVVSAGVVVPDLFKKWGYSPDMEFPSQRGLYHNFADKHTIEACCKVQNQWVAAKKKNSPKIARFVMIERK